MGSGPEVGCGVSWGPAAGPSLVPVVGLVVGPSPVPAAGSSLGLVAAPSLGLSPVPVVAPSLGLSPVPVVGLSLGPSLGLVVGPSLGPSLGSGTDPRLSAAVSRSGGDASRLPAAGSLSAPLLLWSGVPGAVRADILTPPLPLMVYASVKSGHSITRHVHCVQAPHNDVLVR
ncbi:hypothetical protein AB0I49_03240 [Streptomyces sp. NPDC050617]|uniref:hypothetical protein n=1 Tax=Streptomyces sp. NPDC050617 TaxID=3154628 RepID=UPI0034314CCA